MQDINNFLLELRKLKTVMGFESKGISKEVEPQILKTKQSTLKFQIEKVREKIDDEVELFLTIISLHQTRIEVLNDTEAYLLDELKKTEEQHRKITATQTAKVVKGV